MSYSILEAIVVSTGYKIQDACARCAQKCPYASISMFSNSNEHINELKAFANADSYLTKTGIINLTDRARNYYKAFRNKRNSIHLVKNAQIITSDRDYTKEGCQQAIEFLQKIIKHIRDNYIEFKNKEGCRR